MSDAASNQHSELRELAESALRRPVRRHTGVLVTDVQAKALAHGVCDLLEQLEAAQEAAQKNWDEHSERQLAALDRDPERELRRVKEQLEDEMNANERVRDERDRLLEQLDAVKRERDRLRNALRKLADAVDEPWRSELHDALDESAAAVESIPASERQS